MQCDVATSITSITRKDDPNVNSSESGKKSKSLRNWMDKLGRQILDSAVEGEREGGGERPLRSDFGLHLAILQHCVSPPPSRNPSASLCQLQVRPITFTCLSLPNSIYRKLVIGRIFDGWLW